MLLSKISATDNISLFYFRISETTFAIYAIHVTLTLLRVIQNNLNKNKCKTITNTYISIIFSFQQEKILKKLERYTTFTANTVRTKCESSAHVIDPKQYPFLAPLLLNVTLNDALVDRSEKTSLAGDTLTAKSTGVSIMAV